MLVNWLPELWPAYWTYRQEEEKGGIANRCVCHLSESPSFLRSLGTRPQMAVPLTSHSEVWHMTTSLTTREARKWFLNSSSRRRIHTVANYHNVKRVFQRFGELWVRDHPYIVFEHLRKGHEQRIGLLYKVHFFHIWNFFCLKLVSISKLICLLYRVVVKIRVKVCNT